jgi:hypothetical protein
VLALVPVPAVVPDELSPPEQAVPTVEVSELPQALSNMRPKASMPV